MRIVLADVLGHRLPAALVASMVKVFAFASAENPKNRQIYRRISFNSGRTSILPICNRCISLIEPREWCWKVQRRRTSPPLPQTPYAARKEADTADRVSLYIWTLFGSTLCRLQQSSERHDRGLKFLTHQPSGEQIRRPAQTGGFVSHAYLSIVWLDGRAPESGPRAV
jgi:hypothetical protein